MVCIATLGTARCISRDVNAGANGVTLGYDAQSLSLLHSHLREQQLPADAYCEFREFEGPHLPLTHFNQDASALANAQIEH
jgi:hypothetical protein